MHQKNQGTGSYQEVTLSDAARYLALPRAWHLTAPSAAVGGGHAGYRIYPCKDGRVAVAALEPHFAARLCAAADWVLTQADDMCSPATHQAIAAWLLTRTRQTLDQLAADIDIPLHTLA